MNSASSTIFCPWPVLQAIGRIDERVRQNITLFFLEIIEQEDPGLISETNDVQVNYGLSCTIQRTTEDRACTANLDIEVQML